MTGAELVVDLGAVVLRGLRALAARRVAVRQAIAGIRARLQGAAPGQLSLAGGKAGQLSLAWEDQGRLSLPTDPSG